MTDIEMMLAHCRACHKKRQNLKDDYLEEYFEHSSVMR